MLFFKFFLLYYLVPEIPDEKIVIIGRRKKKILIVWELSPINFIKYNVCFQPSVAPPACMWWHWKFCVPNWKAHELFFFFFFPLTNVLHDGFPFNSSNAKQWSCIWRLRVFFFVSRRLALLSASIDCTCCVQLHLGSWRTFLP